MRVKNKVALITGGSAGIRMAIAERFLKEGAKVMITGRSQKRCDAVQKQLETIGADAVDSATGEISVTIDGKSVPMSDLGNIHRTDFNLNA